MRCPEHLVVQQPQSIFTHIKRDCGFRWSSALHVVISYNLQYLMRYGSWSLSTSLRGFVIAAAGTVVAA